MIFAIFAFYFLMLAISDKNPDYLYLVQDNWITWKSTIRYTGNLGATWNTIPTPSDRFISDIAVEHGNEKQVWVTLSGYGAGKVYRYDLTTSSWTSFSSGLPDLPVNCIVIDTFSGTKYVGTDAAVYYMDTSMTGWALYNSNLPAVHVYDLNINYGTGELWAATYGRGMWKSMKADLPSGVAVHHMLADAISVAPNPAHGSFTINASGLSFRNAAVAVRLITADGKVISAANGVFDYNGKLRVNIGDVPAGFYICEVSNDKGVARSRVVVY